MEILSGKSIGRYNKHPRVPMQVQENCAIVYDYITKSEGIKLVNISGADIYDGNEKLLLGLIWTLILRYQINKGSNDGGKAALLEWIRSKIPAFDIQNFKKEWNDGRAICA
jgi:hypothetical protein